MTDIEIPEGFTRWDGGLQPCADDIPVEVILRDGMRLDHYATWVNWDHGNGDYDVIAYRIVP